MLTAASAIKDCEYSPRQLSYVKTLFSYSYTSCTSFEKTPVKNDHIKVRYMGGDCGYDPCSFSVKFAQLFFYRDISLPNRTVFIFSGAHLLFKLRGPPCGYINENVLV